MDVKEENVPYVFLHWGLQQAEKYSSPDSRGFPSINKDILHIYGFRVTTSLRVRKEKDHTVADAYRYDGITDDLGVDASFRFRLKKDCAYFGIVIKW